jgi:hypothetical protein
MLPRWFVEAQSRDLNGAEVTAAPSSRSGFLIIGLFDRRMGGGCALPPIPDSENEIVTRELVVCTQRVQVGRPNEGCGQ